MVEKNPSETFVTSRQAVMPQHANPQQTLFGGQLVAWIDTIAAMAALRMSQRPVVTASIDHISFEKPIFVGDILVFEAKVTYVGCTSMEVMVDAFVEQPYTGETAAVTKAYLTFVALDEQRRPTPVPRLHCETEEEHALFQRAQARMEARKKLWQMDGQEESF